jgi:hypothetical protein
VPAERSKKNPTILSTELMFIPVRESKIKKVRMAVIGEVAVKI